MRWPEKINPLRSPKARISLSVLLVVAGLAIFFREPAEPSYQGRTLSQWLAPTYDLKDGRWMTKTSPEVTAAVQAIGTNAIPHLLRMLDKSDPPFSQFLLQHVFQDIRHPLWNGLGMNRAFFQRNRAANGLKALGSLATNAIPAMLAHRPTGELVEALNGIGPAGQPIVLQYLHDGNEQMKFTCLFALQASAFDRKVAVESWLHHTTNSSPELRWAGTTLLWAAPKEFSSQVVPALQQGAKDPDPRVAAMASVTLQRFKSPTVFSGTLVPP